MCFAAAKAVRRETARLLPFALHKKRFLRGWDVEGEYIVDTSHLVAYEPQMKLSLKLAGGLFSSFFSGEGLVTKVSGNGKIVVQTRSLSGLAGWLNRFL